MPLSVPCDACGKVLTRFPSQVTQHVFCDKECRRRYITRPLSERFWERVRKTETCWLWQGAYSRTTAGYGVISTEPLPHNPRRYRLELAHRVAWKLTYGMIPVGFQVCHNCPGKDNPLCVNPAHLWLGTQADNMRDARQKNGKPIYYLKLSAEQARYALTMKGIISQKALGLLFNVSTGTIQAIHDRRTWRDLEL